MTSWEFSLVTTKLSRWNSVSRKCKKKVLIFITIVNTYEDSVGCVICYESLCTVNVLTFFYIHFQSFILSNDASRLTFHGKTRTQTHTQPLWFEWCIMCFLIMFSFKKTHGFHVPTQYWWRKMFCQGKVDCTQAYSQFFHLFAKAMKYQNIWHCTYFENRTCGCCIQHLENLLQGKLKHFFQSQLDDRKLF